MTLSTSDVQAINSMIETALRSAKISSAGGKSPVENSVVSISDFALPAGVADESVAETAAGNDGAGGSGGLPGGLGPEDIGNALGATGGRGAGAFVSRAAALTPLAVPVAAAVSTGPVVDQVISELQRPGGFIDKRVRIVAQDEAFAGLDRQTRQNTRIGDRQVIIQQFDGFRNFDGIASTNTSRLIRENADRVLDIGLFDRASGVR